ncbi:hypothetical protein Q5P01_020058 [Channa striata]|uniref:Uncharacterized protein n=1 Tax=Channa striata TaxID=64152 RepID=A0AA88LWX2_CHASR|nr:hypothetical protein Q5P01_020058 [Channa striata]
MLGLSGVLGPRPPSRRCDWVAWAFQWRAQVERDEMEGIIGHRYPIIRLEGVPLTLNDGPAAVPGPGSVRGVATRGKTVEASRKMLTGSIASPRLLFCPITSLPSSSSSSSSSPQLQRQTV